MDFRYVKNYSHVSFYFRKSNKFLTLISRNFVQAFRTPYNIPFNQQPYTAFHLYLKPIYDDRTSSHHIMLSFTQNYIERNDDRYAKKIFSDLEVRPCLSHVSGIAESESAIHLTTSLQVLPLIPYNHLITQAVKSYYTQQ